MNALYKLDDLIIEITEKLMHFVQTWTGVNNFAVARFLGIVYVTTGILLIHQKVFDTSLFIFEMLLFVDAVYISFRDEAECRNKPQFKNRSSISPSMRILRIVMLYGISLTSIISLLNPKRIASEHLQVMLHIWLLPTMCYMLACTPLPPGNSKVLSFLRFLRLAQ